MNTKDFDLQFLIKAYLMPVLVVAVILLMIPFVLLPILNRIKDQSSKLQNANNRLEFLKNKAEVLSEVDENQESADFLKAEAAVPSNKNLANLVIGVRTLVSQSGASLLSMSFISPGKVASGSAEIKTTDSSNSRFKMTIKGGLNSLQTFLESVEKAKRILVVDSVAIRYNGGNYEFDIEITAPYKLLKKSTEKINDPIPLVTDSQEKILEFITQDLQPFTDFLVPEVNKGVKNPF